MAERRRMYRVSERIREVAALLLQRSADPRFAFVTITSVVVTNDLREAKIYWTIIDSKEQIQETQRALDGAISYFRHALGKEIDLRFVPNLKFFYDNTADTVAEVEALLERAKGDSVVNEE